jgi:hypothetical protein
MTEELKKRGRRVMSKDDKSKALLDKIEKYKKEGKTCSCCGKKKSFDSFFSSDKRPIFSWCKECDRYKVKKGLWKRRGEEEFNNAIKKQIENLQEMFKIGKDLKFTDSVNNSILEITKIKRGDV